MKASLKQPSGMPGFIVVWLGQLVSLTGSGLTWFALALWAWERTGTATALALVAFFAAGPAILVSPFAGALVDRWNRKAVMILSDLGAGLATIAILLLYLTGTLEVWHLYVTSAFAGIFQVFQWPAYSAAITTMVPKEQYGRANGLMGLAQAVSAVVAPLVAGVLVGLIGIGGVVAIDVATFLFAVVTLLLVRVPQPPTTVEGQASRGSLLSEAFFGFRYIWRRPSLLGLQLAFFSINLLGAFANVLLAPMILARTANNAQILGTVLSALGIGGVIGGLLMSSWGGPKPRVHGVLGGMAFSSIFLMTLMGLGRGLPVWVVAGFVGMFFLPIINGSNQAIWQAKVAPDVQGKVFSARLLIAQVSAPLAMLLAGPLADRFFEPGMQPGGALVGLFGGWVGSGPGAGMALMMVIAGVLGTASGLLGYAFPAVRHAETILPDYLVPAPARPAPVADALSSDLAGA